MTYIDVTRHGFTGFIGLELPVVDSPDSIVKCLSGTLPQRFTKLGFALFHQLPEVGRAKFIFCLLPRGVAKTVQIIDIERVEHPLHIVAFQVEKSSWLGLACSNAGKLNILCDTDTDYVGF